MTGLESSVRGRELGRRLLAAQQAAGFNGQRLAAKLEWSASKLSRTMSGQRMVSDTEVASILGLCDVMGPERDEALRLCYPYQDMGLHLSHDEQWPVYLGHAGETVRLVEFQPFIVPWMIQTTDYTRALIADGAVARADQEAQLIAWRTAVQLMELPRVELLLHEWSLRTPLRDAATMSEQLHYLLLMSVLPSVSIRVVPIGQGVHAGHHGPFTLLEFAEYPSVLYREDLAAVVLLDEIPVVDRYRSVADHLDQVALDEQESRALISQIATEQYSAESAQSDGEGEPCN